MQHGINKSRDSSVCISTRYRLNGPGIESRCGAIFSAPVQTGPGVHPTSRTMVTGCLYQGGNSFWCGVDYPTHSSATVVNEWSCAPVSSLVCLLRNTTAVCDNCYSVTVQCVFKVTDSIDALTTEWRFCKFMTCIQLYVSSCSRTGNGQVKRT
jgi:hypothetical protein